MKTLIIFLCLCGTAFSAELSTRELHRLAAYSAYLVSVSSEIGGGTNTPDNKPSGGVCPECEGVGKVGDGAVMFTCGACGGTGKASSATPDVRPGTPGTPKENEQKPASPDQKAADQPKARVVASSAPAAESPKQQQPPEPEPKITQLRQSNWNWSGVGNPPDSAMRRHLIATHDVDSSSANKMSRQEMIAIHNLLHNSEVRAAAPRTKTKSSSSCPSGSCPTSGSSSSRRYGLFGRRR